MTDDVSDTWLGKAIRAACAEVARPIGKRRCTLSCSWPRCTCPPNDPCWVDAGLTPLPPKDEAS